LPNLGTIKIAASLPWQAAGAAAIAMVLQCLRFFEDTGSTADV
jgi:hypothetical protein